MVSLQTLAIITAALLLLATLLYNAGKARNTTGRVDGKTIRLVAPDMVIAYHGFIAAVLCGTAVSS